MNESCHRRTAPTGQNGPVVEPRYQPDQTHNRFSEDEIVGDVWSQGRFGSDDYPFEDALPFEDTSPFEDDPTPVVDDHPNVLSLYQGGTVFLDQFFSNEYMALCQENLYYLFASGVDWELALWLLRSRLSMAAIDEFLSLQLVHPSFFLLFFEANWYLRLSSCPSHFDWQRNFTFVQKCYHLALTGNPTLSALGSLQSSKQFSTIGTRSNVSSPYSVIPSSVHTSLSSCAKYGLHLHGLFRFMRIGCRGITPGVYRYANYFSDLDAFLTLQRIKYPTVEHFSASCCLPTR